MPGPMDLNPDRVSQLLHAEAQGQIPEPWKPVLQKLRDSGTLPPPLPGGSQVWGTTLASGRPTSAYAPAIPPAPSMGRLDSAAAEIPGMVESAKSGMKSTGKAFLDTVADPEALAATGGGLAGGAIGGLPGALIGAGGASAAMAGAREHFAATKENRPESISPAASAFVSGAAGEVGARLLPESREMTPIGQKTAGLLGDKAMIPDLVNSPAWDFARNVAREGFLGRKKMLQREQENAGTLLGKVTSTAEKELPKPAQGSAFNQSVGKPAPSMLNPDASMAGREAQDRLRSEFVDNTDKGKALYKGFMKQYGDTPVTKGKTDYMTGITSPGKSFKDMHQQRSDLLEQARAAADSNDYKGQLEAMKQAHSISDKMEAADPSVFSKYSAISNHYGKIMEQFDNPVVRDLRENVPAEKVVDVMLHPDKLNTFVPFRDISTVVGRSMTTHQSISQEDAVHLVRMALGDEKFRQLRADTIMQLGQGSKVAEHGAVDMLNGRDITNQLQRLPPNVQTALFGPGTSQALNDIADVTLHTQRTRSGTGALWIVMRQPSEALKVGSGLLGAAGIAAGTGYKTGHEDLGLTSAGAILMSPMILSNILRSPTATKLFTHAIGAEPGLKAKLIQRLITQIPAEAAREQTSYADGAPTIPNPPTR